MALKLVIGNKNYSSWSFRAWLAMKGAGISFEEHLIPLDQSETHAAIRKYSPAGLVPVLIDGDVRVWETLAIFEYLADKFPEMALWPSDLKARAHARTIAAEMHAGFAPLRKHCPMNVRRTPKAVPMPAEVVANAKRIDALWVDCRARFGMGGPFLFGPFSAADAMYAPVVSRFEVYQIDVSAPARAYMDAVRALSAWKEWKDAAAKEPWIIPEEEV
ncbi:MAG TPA: glutathione S-transferase family protein [Xanthobacteraceae bacterium]|jgi:glutathione S-transferase|nr:glutathione S-transferase family protein [Xanthobacteraceae bacterium]